MTKNSILFGNIKVVQLDFHFIALVTQQRQCFASFLQVFSHVTY